MKLLASPGGVAACALLLAIAVHPAASAYRQETSGIAVVVLLALLLLLAVILRGLTDLATGVLALGASMMAAGIGYDTLRGHQGELVLREGQGRQAFEEKGPAGLRLGLRPLGAVVSLQTIVGDDATLALESSGSPRREHLRPDQAVATGDVRLGWDRLVPQQRLMIGLTRGEQHETVEIAPGVPGTFGDLEIAVERYFPDFALDDKNQPFTRSQEPRNPAALLEVRRGDRPWRVLVLQAMPGIHDVPEIGWRFSLRGVVADPELYIAVYREPAALLAVGGALVAATGLLIGWRRWLPAPRLAWMPAAAPVVGLLVFAGLSGTAGVSLALMAVVATLAAGLAALGTALWGRFAAGDLALLAGAFVVALLVLGADGSVLAWRFAQGAVEMPGMGVVLGLLLLVTLAGMVLLGADRLAPGASARAATFGRRSVLLGVGLGAIASGLMLKDAFAAEAGAWSGLAATGGGVASGTWLLALGSAWLLAETRESQAGESGAVRLASLAAAVAGVALAAAGFHAWERHGTYAAGAAPHTLCAALAGIAAAQPTAAPMTRLALFLAAATGAVIAHV